MTTATSTTARRTWRRSTTPSTTRRSPARLRRSRTPAAPARPTGAPNVTASPGNQQIGLSWGAVSGASSYDVFRAEGIYACDFGKVKIGSTGGTSFNDSGLQNGRDYSYVVIPKGSAASCFGHASACDTAQPASAPDFSVSCSPSSFAIQQGNNDTVDLHGDRRAPATPAMWASPARATRRA